MAAYCRVYDSRHLQADCQEPISSGTLRSVIAVWASFTFSDDEWRAVVYLGPMVQRQRAPTAGSSRREARLHTTLTLCARTIASTHCRLHSRHSTIQYEIRYTIREAILTCAGKPTRVSLIYRTEPTTKKCKTEKVKSKKRICSEVTVKVWEMHVVSPEEEKRLQWEGFAEKRF